MGQQPSQHHRDDEDDADEDERSLPPPSLLPPPSIARQNTIDLFEPDPLAHEELTGREAYFDERIRTISQAITALGVIAAGMYYLKDVLIPFLLALALKYLLTPLIDCLACQEMKCRFRLPRALAVLLAILVAFLGMVVLALILARSLSTFKSKSDFYGYRVQQLALREYITLRDFLPSDMKRSLDHLNVSAEINKALAEIKIGNLILDLLGTAGALAETVLYVTLILMFLLVGHGPADEAQRSGLMAKIDKQIFVYIRGKIGLSLLVAVLNCTIYFLIGLELWLVFGVLAFFLSFIPAIGLAISVCLPMPIVILDPSFTFWPTLFAFWGPVVAVTLVKDVLEPLVLGNATSLQPVAVVLAIMLFGSVWGIPGMIMAVPMTAVIRLVLSNVDHPLAKFVVLCLAGTNGPPLPEVMKARRLSRETHSQLAPPSSTGMKCGIGKYGGGSTSTTAQTPTMSGSAAGSPPDRGADAMSFRLPPPTALV
jgi:hypothetical protein